MPSLKECCEEETSHRKYTSVDLSAKQLHSTETQKLGSLHGINNIGDENPLEVNSKITMDTDDSSVNSLTPLTESNGKINGISGYIRQNAVAANDDSFSIDVDNTVDSKISQLCENNYTESDKQQDYLDSPDSAAGSKQTHKIFARFSSDEPDLSSREVDGDVLEASFVLLTASFATDKATLEKRLENCQHNRATSEETMLNEINSLLELIRSFRSSIKDSKTKEGMESLEMRVQDLFPLALRLSTRAENCGAVKQEKNMAVSIESILSYVEHLKRLYVQESNEHQMTRMRLLDAQKDWTYNDVGDNSVNVNITRRSSTIGGLTQTIGRRRASIAITALPNILGNGKLKEFSMEPKTRFQNLVKKTSLTNCFLRTGSREKCKDSDDDYIELPAVTVNRKPLQKISSESDSQTTDTNEVNDHSTNDMHASHVAVIKTISAIKPSVETVKTPEKGEVRVAVRRRRSMKRQDTANKPNISNSFEKAASQETPSRSHRLLRRIDSLGTKFAVYRNLKERYSYFNEAYPNWKAQLSQFWLVLVLFLFYVLFGSTVQMEVVTSLCP